MMAAKGKKHVDVAFWGGVIPGNQVRYVQNIWVPSQSISLFQTILERKHVGQMPARPDSAILFIQTHFYQPCQFHRDTILNENTIKDLPPK